MSELRTDTITASDGTSPVTLTKQEAIKFWVTYNAVNNQTEGSLNQSGLIDEAAGRHHSTFTTVFGSSTDKCAIASVYNSANNTAHYINDNRGGVIANIGTSTSGTFRALSASEIQFQTSYGSHASAHGDQADLFAVYVMVTGDLA
jgi:hypothetical protein